MIFPTLKGQQGGYVNFDLLAKAWLEKHPDAPRSPNPFLDVVAHAELVYDFHKEAGLVFSYGGWLEERSTILAGTYLEKEKIFMHLGVDLNPPEGTLIAVDDDAQVILVDDDHPWEGGWGPHVMVKLAHAPVYLLYAHLSRDIRVKVGDAIENGTIIGSVGPSTENGGWFPHLHLQALSEEGYAQFKKDPDHLDGYGHVNDRAQLAKLYPDPLPYIRLA